MMAVADADHETIRSAAHGLKSSAATHGAFELARLATKLEACATAAEPIGDCLLLAALPEAELAAVETALGSLDRHLQISMVG